MVRINEVMGDGFKPFRTHEQILRNYKNDSNRQIKIILLNNRRPLFRRAYRGGKVIFYIFDLPLFHIILCYSFACLGRC